MTGPYATPGPKTCFLDLEATGLDERRDRILEIAVVVTDSDFRELGGMQSVIACESLIHLDFSDYVHDMHTRNGLLDAVVSEGRPMALVEAEVCEFLDKFLDGGSDLMSLAGNSVHFDRRFLAHWMPCILERFHHRHTDVSACALVTGVSLPKPQATAHRAMADALDSLRQARAFRRMAEA